MRRLSSSLSRSLRSAPSKIFSSAAARSARETASWSRLAAALEKILLGAERRLLLSDDDKRRTAYHEAGHALAAMLAAGADPVRRISIIPRGEALGVTLSAPDGDRFSYTRDELEAKACVLLAGRAAEEVVFGDMTTTAESDLEQVTAMARRMFGRWGMSKAVGLMTVIPNGHRIDGGEISPQTLSVVDSEVKQFTDDAYSDVTDLLRRERGRLDALAMALLAHETLDADDAYAAAGVRRLRSSDDAKLDVMQDPPREKEA